MRLHPGLDRRIAPNRTRESQELIHAVIRERELGVFQLTKIIRDTPRNAARCRRGLNYYDFAITSGTGLTPYMVMRFGCIHFGLELGFCLACHSRMVEL